MTFYASYPVTGGSGAVPTYATLAAFPSAAGAGNGALAIALNTDILYISTGSAWEVLADPAIGPLAISALTGDGTATGPGSVPLTLATVNSNVGSFGTASSVSTVTVNAKGLTTAASNTAIQIAESQVTNLVTDLAAKQSTTLTSAHLLVGNGSNVATDVAASGDLALANTGAFTLNTVNSNVGSFGSASSVSAITVNAKGLTTAAASTAIQIAESQVTNLVSDLAAKQSTTLTNTHILVGNGSNVATDVAMSGDATIANTGAVTLKNTGTAGTYVKVTTDAQGRVTSGSASPQAIADGGTGQSTANPAFNALSPLTTKGDLVGFSTVNAAVPVGSNGQVLTADSAQTLGVKWANVAGPTGAAGADADTVLTTASAYIQVVTPTANRSYTLPSTGLPIGSTWYFVNLAAVNASNFCILIKASNGDLVRTVYPGTEGAVIANVAAPTTGAGWSGLGIVGSNDIPVTLTYGSGLGSVTSDVTWWNRNGKYMNLFGKFTLGTVSSSSNAIITIPASLNFDTTNLSNRQNAFGLYYPTNSSANNIFSFATNPAGVISYSSTDGPTFIFMTTQTASGAFRELTPDNIFVNNQVVSITASIPINEWTNTKG